MTSNLSSAHPPSPDYRLLWAKSTPRHPLWKHMLDTAAVSMALPSPLLTFGWPAQAVALLVALHDIGKADATFQHQVADFSDELESSGFRKTADKRYRHERFSTAFVKQKLSNVHPALADAISRALVIHHGHFEDEPTRPATYGEAQDQLYDMLRAVLGVSTLPDEIPSNLSAFGIRLAGHLVLSDWIASNEDFITNARLDAIDDPPGYFQAACSVANDWVSALGLDRPGRPGQADRIVDSPRPIQQALLDGDIPPGLVIIEAPMGEGKTEAAWILAEKWRHNGYRGMYMALPTMATSDSLHRRYRDDYLRMIGDGEDTKLVHGMAWLRDRREPERSAEVGEQSEEGVLAAAWFRPTRRAMLAAHGVGTVDQAMLAAMHVKFGFLRLSGLADRVLVIDEIHAYDSYMSAIIERLLQWCACLKIPVILLSATLSSAQRTMMIEAYGATTTVRGRDDPYPLITMAEPDRDANSIRTDASSSRTLEIQSYPGLLGDACSVAAMGADLVSDGGCCCIIVNTVKQAQAVFREVALPDSEKLLFHARFTASDREGIADNLLMMFGKHRSKRPDRFVVVATQVVEQSLDVDFDYMISEIAPIDLLLQRSGRLHRHHARPFQPILHVLLPEQGVAHFGGTGRVYAEKPLFRTLAILDGLRKVDLPVDFRQLIERCYGADEWEQSAVDWKVIRKADKRWDFDTQMLHQQGRQFALNEPSARRFRPVNNAPTGDDSDDGNGWRARTRLGANDHTVILLEETQLAKLEQENLSMSHVVTLYQRSVKMPFYMPIHSPAPGFKAAVEGKAKLKGVLLLPLSENGFWHGIDEKGNQYEISYDRQLGLLAGRAE